MSLPKRDNRIDYVKFIRESNLKEHTAYLVKVCYKSSNPMHEAILFTGFNTGSYWQIYINNYDCPSSISEIYDIEIIKELYTFK